MVGWSMDPKLEMTRQWIMRADDDLRLAELIQKDSDPIYWAIAFHAQQCAISSKILFGLLDIIFYWFLSRWEFYIRILVLRLIQCWLVQQWRFQACLLS